LAPDPWDDWYEIVDGNTDLRQGDIFRNLLVFWFPPDLPVIEPPKSDEEKLSLQVEWSQEDWIIMSASCDVARPVTYPNVILGQIYPVTHKNLGTKEGQEKDAAQRQEVIRRGQDPGKFLLAECPLAVPAFPRPFVHYKSHVTLPAGYLLRNCRDERLRLRHPFRESFGNWVGTNISRVGPEDETIIPATGVVIFAAHILRATESE
jgi:hypothetical protein